MPLGYPLNKEGEDEGIWSFITRCTRSGFYKFRSHDIPKKKTDADEIPKGGLNCASRFIGHQARYILH